MTWIVINHLFRLFSHRLSFLAIARGRSLAVFYLIDLDASEHLRFWCCFLLFSSYRWCLSKIYILTRLWDFFKLLLPLVLLVQWLPTFMRFAARNIDQGGFQSVFHCSLQTFHTHVMNHNLWCITYAPCEMMMENWESNKLYRCWYTLVSWI